jgi:hypothetical protein
LSNIYDELDRNIYFRLSVFRHELNETESNKKIEKIKEIINSLPKNISETRILNYMPLAI